MACGCAGRMRKILANFGYKLEDGVWRHPDLEQTFPDARIEDDHFRVLIETMEQKLQNTRAANFMRKLRR